MLMYCEINANELRKLNTPGVYSVKYGSSNSVKVCYSNNILNGISKLCMEKINDENTTIKVEYLGLNYMMEACRIIDEYRALGMTILNKRLPVELVLKERLISLVDGDCLALIAVSKRGSKYVLGAFRTKEELDSFRLANYPDNKVSQLVYDYTDLSHQAREAVLGI